MCDLSDADAPPPVHILLNRQLAMQSSRLSQLGHKIQPHVILELENVEWDLSLSLIHI